METANTISVQVPGGAVKLVLDQVVIRTPAEASASPIDLEGSPQVTLVLAGENRLTRDYYLHTAVTAGIHLPPGAGVTICCANGEGCPCRGGASCANTLAIAADDADGAAIGGNAPPVNERVDAEGCGRVDICGGTLSFLLNNSGVAIGGGETASSTNAGGSGGAVSVHGGHITGTGSIGNGFGGQFLSGFHAGSFFMDGGYLSLSSPSPATIGVCPPVFSDQVSNPELKPNITVAGGTLEVKNTRDGCALGGGVAGGEIRLLGGSVTAESLCQPAIGGTCLANVSSSRREDIFTDGGGVDVYIGGGSVKATVAASLPYASNAPAIGDLGRGRCRSPAAR